MAENNKFVRALVVMEQNPNQITNVAKDENLLFFKYKKYVWAFYHSESVDHYYLHFIPEETEVSAAINNWEQSQTVTYSTEDYPQASEVFARLYSTVKGRLYGIDDVLNDIIGNSAD